MPLAPPVRSLPLDRAEQDDLSDAECRQGEVVAFQPQDRHGDHQGKQGGSEDRQREGHGEAEAVPEPRMPVTSAPSPKKVPWARESAPACPKII